MPPKQLYLIRHAQGFHNLSIEGHHIHDPTLTTEGEQQCNTLVTQLTNIENIDCIIASPLKRTLYTALVTFQSLLQAKPDLKIIALPELQETSNLPCDTGSSVADLRQEFLSERLDFSLVGEAWTDKVAGPFTPYNKHIIERCRKARIYLRQLEADNVAVVTHGAVLHYLTNDWQGATTGVGTGWYNCEARTYQFDESSQHNISNATIIETDASRVARTLTKIQLPPATQLELKNQAERMWAADGYISLDEGGEGNGAGIPEAMAAFVGPGMVCERALA